MTKVQLPWAIALCAIVSGCSSPLVRYTPVTGPDETGLVKFQLAESVISFDHGKTAAGIPNDTIVISSVPVPHGEKVYGIDGTGIWDNWGVVTVANVTFRGDTTLIQQLQVTETDERVAAINALGGIATNLGGLLSLAAKQDRQAAVLPKGIAVAKFIASPPKGCQGGMTGKDGPPAKDAISCTGLSLEGTTDFTADISLTAVPVDALPATTLDRTFTSSNFYYSACRQMTIVLKPSIAQAAGGVAPVSVTVAVADPRFLQTIRLPGKGSITVAASCGANSAAQDPGTPTAIDYLNAISAQAKAIKQSLSGSGASGK